MYLGHIGEHEIEAVYEVRAGDNFGWSEREGAFVFTSLADRCNRLPAAGRRREVRLHLPGRRLDHDPPPGCTPAPRTPATRSVGGFVYRGGKVPALWGKYLFGDLVDGRIFYTESQRDAARQDAGADPLADAATTRPGNAGHRAASWSATPGSTCGSATDAAR